MATKMLGKLTEGEEVVYNIGRYFQINLNYSQWDVCTSNTKDVVMPIGAGGILYPLKILLDNYTCDFLDIAPTSDDIWLFSILKDKVSYLYGDNESFIAIAKLVRQQENLYDQNLLHGNDAAIKKIFK